MSDSNEGKGPVAIGMAVIAAIGLAFKAGCAKIATVGDDTVHAIGAASRSSSAMIDDATHSGAAIAPHLEDSNSAMKSVGKEVIHTVGPDAAEAVYDAYKDRQERATRTPMSAPSPMPAARQPGGMPFSQNPPVRQLR